MTPPGSSRPPPWRRACRGRAAARRSPRRCRWSSRGRSPRGRRRVPPPPAGAGTPYRGSSPAAVPRRSPATGSGSRGAGTKWSASPHSSASAAPNAAPVRAMSVPSSPAPGRAARCRRRRGRSRCRSRAWPHGSVAVSHGATSTAWSAGVPDRAAGQMSLTSEQCSTFRARRMPGCRGNGRLYPLRGTSPKRSSSAAIRQGPQQPSVVDEDEDPQAAAGALAVDAVLQLLPSRSAWAS